MGKREDFIVGVAVGSGIIARAAEQGGAEFLFAINAGRLRSMGAPSIASMLPIHNASTLTRSFASREILSQVKIPVYLGINCWSAEKASSAWAEEIMNVGFAGAVNFPTAIHYSKGMQNLLDHAQVGVKTEMEMLSAIEMAGGQAMFYCRDQQQAGMAANKGLSNIIFNFGWNVGGTRSHKSSLSLEEAASIVHDVSRAVKLLNKETRLFLEGGPILSDEELSFVAREAEIDGYVGGSTIDKFPLEASVANQIALYRQASSSGKTATTKNRALVARGHRHGLVGSSYVIQRFLEELDRLAHTNLFIELIAERGQDIGAVVSYIADVMHCSSKDSIGSIEPNNDVPNAQSMAQIFGRRTGAKSIKGFLESQSTALLVISDHGHMPKAIRERIRLLLQNGDFQPVGSKQKLRPVPRLVLVNHESLLDGISGESIDSLPVASLRVPPLRERYEDVGELLSGYLSKLGGARAKKLEILPAARQVLRAHAWIDNEEELRRFAICLLSESKIVSVDAALVRNILSMSNTQSIKDTRSNKLPKEILLQALQRHGFRRAETANALGISRKTLYNRMKRFNLFS